MKSKKIIHSIWQTYQDVPLNTKCMFGKYQYIWSSPKGRISCVELQNPYDDNDDDLEQYIWEIYSYETLFEDVMKFKTLIEAKNKAKEYLD